MTEDATICVEVAYAPPGEQVVVGVRVPAGATVGDAIRLSGIPALYPEVNLDTAEVGVYGQLARLDTPLRDRDRVEIYRRLLTDAKEARRKRAGERKSGRSRGDTL